MANPFLPSPPPAFTPDMTRLAPSTGPGPDQMGWRGFPHNEYIAQLDAANHPAAAPTAPPMLPQSMPNIDAYLSRGGAAAVAPNVAPRQWAPAKEFPKADAAPASTPVPAAKAAVASIAPGGGIPAAQQALTAGPFAQYAPAYAEAMKHYQFSPGALAQMIHSAPNWGPGQQAQAQALSLLGFGDNTPLGQMRAQALQVAGGAYNPAMFNSSMLAQYMKPVGTY